MRRSRCSGASVRIASRYAAIRVVAEHLHAWGLLPEGVSMARLALRWILMFDAVTTAIPGGRTPAQVDERRATYWQPYHDALRAELEAAGVTGAERDPDERALITSATTVKK